MSRSFNIDEFTNLLEAEQAAYEASRTAIRAAGDNSGDKPQRRVVQVAQQTWLDRYAKRLAYERNGIILKE